MAKSALAATAAVYGGRLASAVAQAGALVVLAREVAPSALGVTSVAVVLTGFVGLCAELGLESAASRAHARGDTGHARSLTVMHRWLMAGAGAGVAAVVAVAHLARPSLVPLAFLLLAVWVFVERRNSLVVSLTVAAGDEMRAGLSLGASRVLALLLYTGLAAVVQTGPEVRYFGYLIGSALLSQVLLGTTFRDVSRASRDVLSLEQAIRTARPFWIASMSGQARTLDAVVVGAVGGPAMAGLYALPSRAVAPLRLAATSLAAVAMPRAAKGDWAQVRLLERSMWGVLAGFSVLVATVWWWGDALFLAVLGQAYRGVGEVLAVLMLGVMANIPGALWSGAMQGAGHQNTVAKVGLWLVPFFYAFVGFGVWVGGVQGAAWGVSGTFFLQFLIMLHFRLRGEWREKT